MQLDIHSEVTVTDSIPLVSARTAATTPAALDVRQYEGLGVITLNAELATAGSSPTLNVKLQHCDTTDGSYADLDPTIAFTQVTDAAGAGVQTKVLDFSRIKGFVKVVDAIAGSAAAFAYSVQISGRKKYFNTPAAKTL